jgi:transposase
MQRTAVSPEENKLLHQWADRGEFVLVRKKANAILMAAAGIDAATIATIHDRSESTVGQWLSQWDQTRMASVVTGHAGNLNASKLTASQLDQVRRDLALAPEDHGLPAGFWDVPKLKAHLSTKFEVLYESDTTYHYLLRMGGLELKYPDKLDRRRDDDAVEARMAQIRAEVAPLLQDPNWEVFAADEVRLDQEAIARRAWIPVGTKAILRVDRQVQAQSYLGLLNQRDGQCHMYRLPWQNSTEVIAALSEFLRTFPGKNIAIVWDNAAFHKSKQIRAELTKGAALERVHLIPMPPYAPDHNPIEHVWADAKKNIANIQRDNFDHTTKAFEDHIATRRFNYRI